MPESMSESTVKAAHESTLEGTLKSTLEGMAVESMWRLARTRKFNKTKVTLLEEFYRPYIDPPRRQASHKSK